MLLLLVFHLLVVAALAGFLISFVRWRSAAAAHREEPTLGGSASILPEEWQRVRDQQCLPSGCPRTVGHPPQPRRDEHCEICAGMFLDRYYRRVLGEHRALDELDWMSPRLPERASEEEWPEPHRRVQLEDLPMLEPAGAAPLAPTTRRRWGRWFLVLGLAGLLGAAVMLALLPPAFTLPGLLVGFAGLFCLFRGATSGVI